MGKRGPKPVDMGLLNMWEFEWYKAFHLLREGTQLPTGSTPPPNLNPAELRAFIRRLEQMSAEEYWFTRRRVASKLGQKVNLSRTRPMQVEREWAEREKAQEIFELRYYLEPKRIHARAERREIWNDFIRARTLPALQEACECWEHLPDVRAAGFTCYPAHILANPKRFLSMKRNRRFPRSSYSDDSRLEYLARGMAGVLGGVSPVTAIERLRNMKHATGGPLWKESEQHCDCWRCSRKRWSAFTRISTEAWLNGLRLFIEIAGVSKKSG